MLMGVNVMLMGVLSVGVSGLLKVAAVMIMKNL
jgi:hypothetical protein